MRTSNLDKVLDQVTGADCQQAAEELERYLDAGLTATEKAGRVPERPERRVPGPMGPSR